VLVEGVTVGLTKTEYRLLETMAKEPGRTFNRTELIERVYGYEYEGTDRTIDVHVMNMRKKIESSASHFRYVTTVSGLGYRFEDRHDS
jgi:DNA-binding response OmpR family regulator